MEPVLCSKAGWSPVLLPSHFDPHCMTLSIQELYLLLLAEALLSRCLSSRHTSEYQFIPANYSKFLNIYTMWTHGNRRKYGPGMVAHICILALRKREWGEGKKREREGDGKGGEECISCRKQKDCHEISLWTWKPGQYSNPVHRLKGRYFEFKSWADNWSKVTQELSDLEQ